MSLSPFLKLLSHVTPHRSVLLLAVALLVGGERARAPLDRRPVRGDRAGNARRGAV
ncbi:MAG: hypothetical protein R6X17_07585 [Candidatus Competibacteraceae bacterium]